MSKVTAGINRVLVLPDEMKKTFADTVLLIPENKKKISNYGTIVEVGEMKEPYSLYPNPLKKGDRVLWNPKWYTMEGYEIIVDGKQHFLFHVELILGKFN